ncbi:MAG: exonuclease SbcC, partial [Kiritimatiellia bacterium]
MKIHNIRTFNLNSLYGEFTVDLDDLLSGASLFLIYGPTGSGKSTLMDAVSLALFGQTPRLDDKSGTESRKPHAIMSRGTGMCSASVQFSKLASEGRQTFRAIWTCHRSRKKAGQKPQQAQRSLEILKDGEWELLVSSTKKKVYKAAFDQVLEGFSVQDFNRSMLLAQGQFDAFLGAPPKERAEILERLTDTSVYQQVGERAATIHRRHERRLLALRTLAAADAGLSEQQLSDLEQAHVLNQAQLARANEQHQRCLSALQWLGQALELEEQLQKAKGQQLQLQERQATAKPALDRLAEHERCVVQRAFHLLDDFGRAKDRASVAVRQLKELDALIPELKTKELADGGRAQGQRRVFEAAELDLQRMRPVVALAQRTGEELSAVSGRVRVAKTALERAAKLVLAGELATRKASGVVVDARKRAFSANLEVDQHVADARLLRAWAPLRVRLVTLVAALRQASSRALVLQDGRRSLTVDRQSWKDDSAVFQTSESATLEPLARGVQVAQAHLLGLLEGEDLQPARERRSTLIVAGRSRLQLVQLTVSPTENALRGAGDLARLQGDVFGRRGLFDKAGVQVSSILTLVEREELAVRRDEVAHDRVVRVASLVEHRSALVDGEACPLCGAQEHPWSADSDRAAGDREIREHLAASARALEASRARHSEAVSRHREARELVGRHHAALGLLRGQEQRATETLVDLRAARARALQTADMVQDGVAELTDAELVESVGNVVDAVRREVALAEAAMRELDGARQRHQDAQDAMSGAKESRAHESAVLDRRQAALQERGEQLQRDLLVLSASREDAETEGLACKGVALDLGLSFHGHDPDLWRIMGEERCAAQQLREAALVQANGLAFAAETELNAKVQVADERRSASAQRALELEDLGIEAKEKGDRTDAAMGALHELWSVVVSSDDRRVGEASTLASAEPKELLEAQTGWHDR